MIPVDPPAIIREHEGLRMTAYRCSEGFLTIGYGHRIQANEPVRITKAKALAMFKVDYANAEANARSVLPSYDYQPPGVRCVVVSMCFQLGKAGTSKFRNALANLKMRRYGAASSHIRASLWYRQTPNRVEALIALLPRV